MIDASPAQLARYLADGRSALRAASIPLRLAAAIEEPGRTTPAQRRRLVGRLIADARVGLVGLARWLADHLASGLASLHAWAARFAGIMAPHQYASAMAAVGTLDPTPADRATADEEVRKQLGYLGRFRGQLLTGAQPLFAPTPDPETGKRVVSGRFLARSGLYADAAWGVAEGIVRARMGREGYTRERRYLGGSHHCSGCLDQAAMGWQPIGTLSPIGSEQCKTNCRCYFSYKHSNSLSPVVAPLVTPLLTP